jgi:shikimate dehydrogenase
MTPKISESPWPSGAAFPGGCYIYDLIYNPSETTFIKMAQRSGLAASNGLGMLVEQAALAFESWTGIPAPREVMHDAVIKRFQNQEDKRWR